LNKKIRADKLPGLNTGFEIPAFILGAGFLFVDAVNLHR
jgi:hypothetical protein